MIYLIWSLINGIVILYFLYMIVGFITKGKQIFRPKFKFVPICIMVLGIVQIISASNLEENSNRISITPDYNKIDNLKIKEVTLEDNLTFDINMLLKYSIEQNDFIPIESSSFLTGFVSGYVWEFKSIETNNYKLNEKMDYTATGILKWNLFGITVYSQPKTFSGILK